MISGAIATYAHLGEDNDLTSLPFVADLKENRKVRRCFWHVQPTGRYAEDCLIGKYYALEFVNLALSRDQQSHCRVPMLATIAKDMGAQLTGVEVGFWSTVEDLLLEALAGRLPAARQEVR